ncbi:MAG: DUF4124 domain-containing protein [Pseudomonadota bacterium]
MKRVSSLIVALALFFALNGIAAAQIYKWVDADGKVHFSDQPPNNDSKVEAVTAHSYRGQANVAASGVVKPHNGLAVAAPKVVARAQVELYTTSWCPYCKQARHFFRSRGVSFKDYDVEKDSRAPPARHGWIPRRGCRSPSSTA